MGRKTGSKNVPEQQNQAIIDKRVMGIVHKSMAEYYDIARPTVSNII